MESEDSAFFFVVAKCVKLREESKLGIGLNIMAKHLKTQVSTLLSAQSHCLL